MTATIVSECALPAPIDEVSLFAWLAQAEPGEALEYHRGFLLLDRAVRSIRGNAEARRDLIRTSNQAMRLADLGLVHLVQRRLGDQRFSYLAIARPRSARALLSLSTLVAEEAA